MENVQKIPCVTAQCQNVLARSSIAKPNRRVSDPLPQEWQFRSTKTRDLSVGLLIAGYFRSVNMLHSDTWLVL